MSDTHAQTVAYVRDTMLAESAPPLAEKGAVKWFRENLFSSPVNVLLTIVSLFVLFLVLRLVLPWLTNAVWDANSLSECREILAAKGLGSHDGACLAVIKDRWHQLMFGFYPSHLYWRPVLAFVLFLVAIMPVLFSWVPRQALYLTAAAPFLGYWLVWGGSIWGIVFVALAIVIGYAVFRALEGVNGILATVGAILVPIIYLLYAAGPLAGQVNDILPIGIEAVKSNQLGGFTLAIIIGLAGIVLSLPLGILLALGRQSDLFIIKTFSVIFIEVIRGVPLIVWLFTASLLLNYFLPPGTNFDLVLRVIIMVTLFSAAYIAEVVRGGLAALPTGQYEAADALGLDYPKSMRLIVLPQALKISIPGIVNTFIGLFKDTTLVVFIGLSDPIGFTNLIRANTDWNGIYWELFGFVGLVFFILCFSMGRYSLWLERQLQREHR